MLKKKLCLSAVVSFLCAVFLFMLIHNNESYAKVKGIISVGTAKAKITPETPVPLSGYGSRKEPFKGVHDDVFVRTMVFSDGSTQAALIVADLIGFSSTFQNSVTKRIEKETGIPLYNILLCATHTHAGPTTLSFEESDAHRVADKYVPSAKAYVKELEDKIVKVTKEAVNNLSPAAIGAGKGECLMNINRRARDGKGGTTLGRNPYGVCDHEVGVVRIDDRSKNPIAFMVNWPCHGTTLGPGNYLISGDWPGTSAQFVEKAFDNKAVVQVTAGASGDINPIYGPHIDFSRGYRFAVDAIGNILGEEAVRVGKEIKTDNRGSVSVIQKIVTLPGKVKDKGLDVNVTLLKIGDIVLVGLSAELFNEIGIKLKEKSPYSNTFILTHCNGSSGYVVTNKSYAKGGYEPNYSKAKIGAEQIIIDAVLDMIKQL
ncbi:neutral/alkaline non-lysosomal ceramidase N-terminal domain-containing protein [bacterium]|nr:neutral/alkaline non-lysosomal ceramidase N-terminal domain-containing protein [bacterium]